MFGFDYKNKVWKAFRANRYGALFAETIHLGFVEGKEFRCYHEMSLTEGQSSVIKFVSPCSFIIHTQDFSISEGEIRFEAIQGGSEGGSFSTDVPTFGKNRSSERPEPYYERQAILKTGGTLTNGDVSEVVVLKSTSVAGKTSSVGSNPTNVRFLPAGTYYLKFTATGTTKIIYNLEWEERP